MWNAHAHTLGTARDWGREKVQGLRGRGPPKRHVVQACGYKAAENNTCTDHALQKQRDWCLWIVVDHVLWLDRREPLEAAAILSLQAPSRSCSRARDAREKNILAWICGASELCVAPGQPRVSRTGVRKEHRMSTGRSVQCTFAEAPVQIAVS
jgi:hypothetical protein